MCLIFETFQAHAATEETGYMDERKKYHKNACTNFDVLLTVHLSIILVINLLNEQDLVL